MCGQRWGLLERIFISESRKLTATTGERHLDKRTLPLVEGKIITYESRNQRVPSPEPQTLAQHLSEA